MKIEIEYESSWRNSFLDGNNNQVLPKGKKGRTFIGSITALNKNSNNYIKRSITLDTVMGILNRLIGDQKKLYQSRKDNEYFFKDIESKVTFKDNIKILNDELVYLRNISGNTDQNSYTGLIKTNDKLFTSDYSKDFWGVLAFDIDELIEFITHGKKVDKNIELDPIFISDRFDEIKKIKALEESELLLECLNILENKFEGIKYKNNKNKIVPLTLYCSALYLQIERLSIKYNLSSALTKSGTIPGISKRSFTKKDFMYRLTTGEKKKIFGNPYISKSFKEAEGPITAMLTKANGTLEINIDIKKDKAKYLKKLIENAGVSSFYLGKKGLAYVTNIDTREVS